MRTLISRAMLTLAAMCMEEKHRAWGIAMRGELEEAIDADKPFRFASGCLVASLRRMPAHAEGRFRLTAWAFVLGLMIPMAALQVGCAVLGLPYFVPGGSIVARETYQDVVLISTYDVIPPLMMLMLLLGVGHLRMAWLLLNRDWSRVMTTGALTLATIITLVTFMAVLFMNVTQALLQAAILVFELVVLAGLAHWHTELPQLTRAHHATE
jgi:hypothetical protein